MDKGTRRGSNPSQKQSDCLLSTEPPRPSSDMRPHRVCLGTRPGSAGGARQGREEAATTHPWKNPKPGEACFRCPTF